jgi:hypothetical protein
LTEFLRFYRDAFRQYYGTSRLLFVLDALEDSPEGEALRILDSLPGPDFFSDGVYVLLTTRPVEELTPRLAEAVALREVTEHFSVDRRRPWYLDGPPRTPTNPSGAAGMPPAASTRTRRSSWPSSRAPTSP